jgi:hypothetical protein
MGYPLDDERYETFIACLLEHASLRLGVSVTNGIIDFTSMSDRSTVLQHVAACGWIDPSLEHVRSASRKTIPHEVLPEGARYAALMRRGLSMITTDPSVSSPLRRIEGPAVARE